MYAADSIQSDCILVGQQTELEIMDDLLFEMYPNPAYDYVDLHLASPAQRQITYRVVDLTGRIHHEASLPLNGQKSVRLQTESYPSGIYFVQIEPGDGVQLTKKLIISHP